DFPLRGLGSAGRRHLAPTQFAHSFLEYLGLFGHRLRADLVQEEVAGANAVVVTTEAVGLNCGPLRLRTLRDLNRGLGEDLGVDRNNTDGARNADKPSSEFHISHHLARFIPGHRIIVDYDTGKQGSGNRGRTDGVHTWDSIKR